MAFGTLRVSSKPFKRCKVKLILKIKINKTKRNNACFEKRFELIWFWCRAFCFGWSKEIEIFGFDHDSAPIKISWIQFTRTAILGNSVHEFGLHGQNKTEICAQITSDCPNWVVEMWMIYEFQIWIFRMAWKMTPAKTLVFIRSFGLFASTNEDRNQVTKGIK